MFQIGQISLTKLWTITREHPELVKEVTFKDGHTEKMLNINISTSKYPSQHATETISAKPKDVSPNSKEEWRYWEFGGTKFFGDTSSAPAAPQVVAADDDVPF